MAFTPAGSFTVQNCYPEILCFSDDATWMSHRNDNNFLKRAGNRNEWGVFSFGYFSLDKQRKVTRQQAK
jgi:hypothetical protein